MTDVSRETISQGSTVMLKSGGPRMTVARFDGDNARCIWMNSTGRDGFGSVTWTAAAETFPVACLIRVKE